MDVFRPEQRSEIMRRVRSAGTRPELAVRKLVRDLGIKFRAAASGLPGKPDLAIFNQKKAVFVHGCFWHRHNCEAAKLPKSNRAYWKRKQAANAARDRRNLRALRLKGWKSIILWECQLKATRMVEGRLFRFLSEKHE
jgi:DNA mismatch endonuclease (patch repair protein)